MARNRHGPTAGGLFDARDYRVTTAYEAVFTASYDADSRRTTLVTGLGNLRRVAFDALGRATTLTDQNIGGFTLTYETLSYDPVGNKVRQFLMDGLFQGTTTWVYDAGDRLIEQLGGTGFATFTYDPVGNLTKKHHEGSDAQFFTNDAASRIVTMVQGAVTSTFTYDANGNNTVVNEGGNRTTNTFDPSNRLIAQARPDSRSTYTYDGDALRRSVHEGGVLSTIIWDGSDYLQERKT